MDEAGQNLNLEFVDEGLRLVREAEERKINCEFLARPPIESSAQKT